MPVCYHSKNRTFELSGGNVSYVLHVDEDGILMNHYWGRRVPELANEPHRAN